MYLFVSQMRRTTSVRVQHSIRCLELRRTSARRWFSQQPNPMWGTRQDGGPRPALLVVASGRGTRGAGLSPVLAEKPAALLTRSWGKAPPVTPARGDALLGAPQSLSRACSLSRQHGLMMTSVRRAGDAGPGEEPNGHSSRPRRAHSLAGGSRAGGEGGGRLCAHQLQVAA